MALRMLGRMHQQAKGIGRKPRSTHLTGSSQVRFFGCPQLLQREINLPAQAVQQLFEGRGGRSRVGLFAQRRALAIMERLSPGIGEEAIQHPGDVLQVKAGTRHAPGPGPENLAGQIGRDRFDLFPCRKERMGNRLEQRRNPRHGASQPDFGLGSSHNSG